jgi:hypothetical protein
MSPKSKGRKKKKKQNRYIPKKVSDSVKEKHFFQCAWCCENLTDRHHIEEYSDGGKHTEDNLILLCPNCHRDVHNDKIDKGELILRKSTHLKNDRLSGGLRINIEELKIRALNNLFIDTERILVLKGEDLLTTKLENNSVLISTQLYDADGNLYFWMRNNRYWASSNFTIESRLDYLEIKDNNERNKILIEINDDILNLSGNFYYQKNSFTIPLGNTYDNVIKNCVIGINVD